MYQVGDKVRWTKGSLGSQLKQSSTGVILQVIPSDYHIEGFNLYDVQFDFGICTLYDKQLVPDEPSNDP